MSQSKVFMISYLNICSRESFDNLRSWEDEIKSNAHKEVIIVLVGNKNDLE